jgi:hypothetical protein
MDPSLEDPSSLTTGTPQSHPTRRRRRRENRCEQNDLNKFRPKNADEENLDVQTAGIKR